MMYTIGEFSEKTGISKRMLRHYDKLKLFCPDTVNEDNNYRLYNDYQIEALNKIQFLNALGFSLNSIKEILSQPISLKEFTDLLYEKEVALTKAEDEIKSNLVVMKKLINMLEKHTDKMFPSVYKLLDMERSFNMIHAEKIDLKSFMNRDLFMEKIEGLMEDDHNDNYQFICFDIDHFMNVNDINGYEVGDAVISKFIEIIMGQFNPLFEKDSHALYTRLGGDEFSIFLKNHSEEEIEQLVSSTLKLVEAFDFNVIGCTVDVTVSAGIARSKRPEHIAKFHDLAVKALINAKRQGRNQYTIQG